MELSKDALSEREEFLNSMIKKAEGYIRKAPEGTLRINCSGKRVQYFYRKEKSDRYGTYLRKNEKPMAEKLAQKDYCLKVLKSALQEKRAIKEYMDLCPEITPETVYDHLSERRKELVVPLAATDEMYAENWQGLEYQGKEFTDNIPELQTDKGERVRSKSEVIIANQLAKAGVPYRYEYPIMLKGWGTVYPDFTVLNIRERKELYWEHQGMMDNPEYADQAVRKEAQYIQNGIFPGDRLILTSETKQSPINIKQIRMIIDKYLK